MTFASARSGVAEVTRWVSRGAMALVLAVSRVFD